MADLALDALRWQFDMVWALASQHHLPALTDELLLWQPAPSSWTARLVDGVWQHDWSEEEPATPAPPSGAWITWQIAWWWTETLARVHGESGPGPQGVRWPGSADGVRLQLGGLADRWRDLLAGLDAAALARPSTFPWPEPRPFAMTVAWAHGELMKNVAELGVLRLLYQATRGA